MHRCASRSGGPNMKKILLAHFAWSALPIGGGGHRCANILVHRCTLRHYCWRTDPSCTPTLLVLEREPSSVLQYHVTSFTSPIGGPDISVRLAHFHPNRLLTGLYRQEQKYVEEKTTATLKSKQTSIAIVRKHLRTVASLPTPLPFHYPQPLSLFHL
jgi:hypothetical protein